MMKTYMTRILTVVLLMMFSMGASADVKIFYGEKGEELKTGETKIKADNGTIAIEQKASDDGSQTTIYLTFTPETGYTISTDNIEVYAVISPSSSPTRTPEISGDPLKLNEETSKAPEKRYSVKIDSNLGLWIKKAEFVSGSKGNRTDYSGTYYIKSNNDVTYYLCTSTVYYDGNHYANSGDMPYLTTAKTVTLGDMWDNDAVWRIIKAESGDYYYVVHAVDGKYLTYNDDPTTNADKSRLRVHLQYLKDGDNSLFIITKNDNWYNISPKNDKDRSLNPAGDNKDKRAGDTNKTETITGISGGKKNVGGLIGLWGNSDAKSKWQMEEVADKPICDTPTFENNGSVSISCVTEGATIYYTIDGSTVPSTASDQYSTPINVTEGLNVIWARATTQDGEPYYWSPLSVYEIPQCAKPVISIVGGKLNLSCDTEGVTFYYTINGSEPTTEYDPNNKPDATDNDIIKAIAKKAGFHDSDVATVSPPQTVHNTSAMTNMYAHYILASDFAISSSIGTEAEPFCGIIDGGLNVISGASHPLVAYANGATIKNVILKDVNITSGNNNGNTGAICNEATGDTRIYNCGILATTVYDAKGNITGFTGSSVSGSGNVGGIVGSISGNTRVINCYSYANITGGSVRAGIVGYNSYASKSGDIQTMVMNCMFYGDISTSGTISPIYGGLEISNEDNSKLNNYNYFRYESPFSKNNKTVNNVNTIISAYNRALSAEERYLRRFEFYRYLLNSNRELAAAYIGDTPTELGTGDNLVKRYQKEKMAKWVLDKSIAPYPILSEQGTYPSVVNYDPDNTNDEKGAKVARSSVTERNKGKELGSISVTISGVGSNAPQGASLHTTSLTLKRTDKDYINYNYNYNKIQLPYYNEVGTGNYTKNKVVTGWKVRTSSKAKSFGTANYDYPNYNLADRSCSEGRVYSQGAYFDVPDDVSSISIEPYWGSAVYLSDGYHDSYSNDVNYTSFGLEDFGKKYVNDQPYYINPNDNSDANNQKVYTSVSTAVSKLPSATSVYDNAVVLVGNYHCVGTPSGGDKPFTIMSADLDHDNEPDYSLIIRSGKGAVISPIRFDFINVPGVVMAHKRTSTTQMGILGNMKPKGWFEVTNTAVIRFSQMEYDYEGKSLAPLILLGGVVEQFVSTNSQDEKTTASHTKYIHVGSNVWFKLFSNGCHMDKKTVATPHRPISVTGGEYEIFYLSGYFKPDAPVADNADDRNAECYIDGGKFGEVAGSGQEQVDGNVIWDINNADIDYFYGGGINDAKPVTGNINVTIKNSHVGLYCGGPKFGNMTGVLTPEDPSDDKTVSTIAEGCTFGNFYGAGYGGTSLYRDIWSPGSNQGHNQYQSVNYDWLAWLGDNRGYSDTGSTRGQYVSGKGVAVGFETEQFEGSDINTVARLYVNFATLSVAKTNGVTSNLTGCTIEENFYGGGNLGAVNGDIISTLTNCTVDGSVFGAGCSATAPTTKVYDSPTEDNFTGIKYNTSTGIFEPTVYPPFVEYTWSNTKGNNSDNTFVEETIEGSAEKKYWIHVDYNPNTKEGINLEELGSVSGTATLNIEGSTTVGGSVYGGGEESNVSGDTRVNICAKYNETSQKWERASGTVSIAGDVYGGGKGDDDNFKCDKAMVGKEDDGQCADPSTAENKDKGTSVRIGNGTVTGNVYGGGELGRVEWNTQVTIGIAGDENSAPVVNGSVFGAGAGVETHGYSALVRGNSTVTVQGNANVLHNVYGGGEKATVGRYWVKNIPTTLCEDETQPTVPGNLPDGMPYQQRSGGICTVTIQGGAQIGPDSGGTEEAGHVFGAGKGVVPQFNASTSKKMTQEDGLVTFTDEEDESGNTVKTAEEAYLEFLQTLALVTNSNVTIDGSASVKGSVYGGSESGFVQHDTNVVVKGGTIGTENKGGAYYGNVYGGGKGDAEHNGSNNNYIAAGIVKGNTKVKIENGTILHNIYGGGAYGTVGVFDYDSTTGLPTGLNAHAPENSGKTEIHITGGTIGTTGQENGMIFGSSRGDVGAPGSIHDKLAWVYDTHVAIGDTTENATITIAAPLIKGSIYGGGENGHNFRNSYVRINGGTIGIPSGDNVVVANDDESTTTYEAYNYPYRGNVYGGGCGTDKYDNNSKFNSKAGIVQGNAFVNITAGYVVHNVYGAGAMGSVGTDTSGGKTTVTISGGRIGYDGSRNGNIFGAARGEYGTSTAESGLANVRESHVNISYATTPAGDADHNEDGKNDEDLIAGSVFGGGESGTVKESVAVNMTGGLILKDVYGGGALAHTQTSNWNTTNNTWAAEKTSASSTTTVNLLGGTILGEAYGGGLGEEGKPAYVYGDVLVELNNNNSGGDVDASKRGCVVDQVFGANNINGTPKGNVTVHVYGTQNKEKATIADKFRLEKESSIDQGEEEEDNIYLARLKAVLADKIEVAEALGLAVSDDIKALSNSDSSTADQLKTAITTVTTSINAKTADEVNSVHYDVKAVYGGGNQAAYIPANPWNGTTGAKTQVIIDGCSETSIETVYGGGNAAAVPETNVTINAAYEIGSVFGGGNGKDDIAPGVPNPGANVGIDGTTEYGTGYANTLLVGGYIHEAYGGSNQKGNIKGKININMDPPTPVVCPLDVEKLVGAGKNADVDGDMIMILGCKPTTKTPLIFAGADNANVNGNVEMTITSGSFGQVFGGNNLGGVIKGHIILNIEETGCNPIRIDSLYLGGNEAAYSRYGYYEDTSDDNKVKPRSAAMHSISAGSEGYVAPLANPANDATHSFPYAQPVLNIISCTHIGKVFGGGLGEGAVMHADPTVNINMINGTASGSLSTLGTIGDVYGGGNKAKVEGSTTINIGTETTVQLHESLKPDGVTYNMSEANTVEGAKITGNVYGGGNLADVTGNTFVNICAKKVTVDNKEVWQAVTEGASGVTIGGTVFGGGKGKEDTFLCEKAMIGENNKGAEIENYPNGNTSVRIGHGTVKGSVYGGGEVGRVEMNTVVEIGYGNGGSETKSPIIEGNVFGAGKGVKTHGYSALVRGNPRVTIKGDTWVKKSVYGGGEIASVARYKVAQSDAEGEPYGVEEGEPYLLENSNCGYCYVTVQGNAEIGTSGMKMYHDGVADDKPDDWGHVFAAGKGVLPETYNFAIFSNDGSNRTSYPKRMMLYDPDKYSSDQENKTWEYVDPDHKDTNLNIWEYFNTEEKYFTFVRTLGLATQTYVYIGNDASGATDNPLVYGSVYGGSENGIVQYHTNVYIKSGQIGYGDGETGRYSNWPTEDESFTTSWAECASWVFGLDTNDDSKKDLFAPYDPNANASGKLDEYESGVSTQGGRRIATDGHTYYGNVFGGGSGSVPYYDNLQGKSRYIMSAGQVKGNTNVTITGGHILTNVYGGCEATDVDGTATVTMTGGTIGVPRTDTDIINHPVTGYLFGGGKGDQRVFFNKDTNVKDAVVKVEGGRIYGSVYGGGEDGHVLRNTTVTIGKTGNTGPKIGTSGTSYYDGHVFGGGRGFGGEALTAGNVGGAVTLNILGGDILGSVYGGGRLASVGYGLYLTTETGYGIMRADDEYDGSYTNPSTDEASTFFDKGRGHIIMNISGGTIGNDSEYSYDANSTLTHTKGGNVFAGGMGRMYTLDGTPNTSVDWRKMGCVKSTKLTISGDAVIKSCVYGGGELGQVVGTQKGSETKGTEILIEDGTIGTEIKDGGVTQYTFGSVFGSGYGSDVEDIIVTVDGVETVTKPKLEAGLVKYDTNIDMQGGFVKASIYGGGEMASVGSVTEGESPTVTGSSYVTVSDGSVGIDRVALDGGGYKYFGGATMGNVYGGGSGLRTIVRSGRIMKNATVNISGGRIYHNVYGGGAFGTVGDFNYTVDNTTKKVTAINGLKTTGTGDVTVTITGGTLGTSGRENGMVFGSSRGEVGEERDDWLAWTYDTHVTIGKEDGTGPQINGSVYGGGENGHTWNDAEVIIHGGTIGIPSGEKITMDGIEYDGARFPNRGNVYGGGCGTDDYTGTDGKQYYNPLAGVVYGKATVTMDGGHVVHNVYGAGAMGSVGRFTFDNNSSNTIPDGKPVGLADENTNNGLCYVTISGGKIGMTDMKMKGTANGEPDNFGHVFGAGRGEVKDTTVYVNLPVVGYIKESHVEISGSAFVTGSVYGGGESGHVLGDTYVDIKGGQIGCGEEETAAYTTWNQTSMKECAHWDYSETGVPYDKFSGTDGYTSNGATTATDGHTFYGNVFGGGSGYNPYAAGKWVRSAGLVEGNTNVTISDGHILSSVYGGNEQTDVYGSCTVTMTGGTVGVPRKYDERLAHPVTGNLFGAGKGDKRTLFNTWTNVGSTIVSVSGGTVYGSVFGGGEDGHVLGDAETTISGTETVIGTLGTTGYEGNVFGGGRGSFTALTAGVVGGNVTLNIQGGNILGSVYGGGRLASVGTFFANPKLEDGTTDNPLYGTMQPGDAHGNIRVNISGNSTVIGAVDNGKVKNSLNSIGEVYGGCKGTTDGNLKDKLGVAKSTIVNLLGGTVGNSIYGGGEVGNVGDLGDGEAATKAFAKVNLLGGTVVNVYGGGLGQKNASKNIDARAYVKGNATVNLNGLEIGDYDSSIPSGIVSPVNDDNTEGLDFYRVGNRANGCVVTGNIFGCNNVNGTPTGHAKVHVFMTTPKTGQLATEYDVSAIYGGGNQADYEPAADDNTEVIIEGCGLTKIQQVYGGGNAAASPGTSVLIKGTELIDEVFGGGNGVSTETFDNPGANVGFHTDKSAYTVGDGKTYVQLMAGTINNVFGGSNSNGDIRGGSVITKPTPEYTENVTTSCCPELSVTGAIFGGGKNADMRSGAEIVLGCMPTDWIAEIYAGAEMANVKGDVSLTLTSGKFGRVFGGNKTSGILDGSITVNIQENGSCDVPLVIGELYGGGNMAAYSIYGFEGTAPRTKAQYDALTAEQKEAIELEQPHASPVVNVHGFTSIGNIYGGGYGADADMYGSPTLNINEVLVDDNKAYQFAKDNSANKPALIDGENVKLYDHVQGKMGVISNVFGGGNAAMVDGNTTVNIGTEEEVYVVKLVNVGASVTGLYTRSKNETTGAYEYTATASGATAAENTNYYEKKTVQGADIRGNVYGGGNEAEVTGNTNVNIGRKVNTSTPTTP